MMARRLIVLLSLFCSINIASGQDLTAVPARGDSVFYQMESTGRSNMATTNTQVALVWETTTQGVTKLNVAFKLITATSFSPPVLLSESANSFNPVITACDNHFIAAWVEGKTIRAKLVSMNKLGNTVTVANGDINELTIACKVNKSALLAWTVKTGRSSKVVVAELNIVEDKLVHSAEAVVVPTKKFSMQSSPAVAYAKDRYIVTWSDVSTGTNLLYSSSGKNINNFSKPVQINEWIKKSDEWGRGSSAVRNVLAVAKNELLVIVWLDKRGSRSGYKVYGAFSYDGGLSWGDNYKIGDESANDYPQWSLTLAANRNGQAVVSWMDARYDENIIWLAELHGITWNAEEEISTDGEYKPRSPVVTMGSDGLSHAVWIEDTPTRKGSQIVYKSNLIK